MTFLHDGQNSLNTLLCHLEYFYSQGSVEQLIIGIWGLVSFIKGWFCMFESSADVAHPRRKSGIKLETVLC